MWQVPRDAVDAAPALTQITSEWRKVHILTRSATPAGGACMHCAQCNPLTSGGLGHRVQD